MDIAPVPAQLIKNLMMMMMKRVNFQTPNQKTQVKQLSVKESLIIA